jgi:hypothetical protein
MSRQLLLDDSVRNVTTLETALQLFQTVGMPAKNLSFHTRKNYQYDLLTAASISNT